MENLLQKIKVARRIGHQMFGNSHYLIVVDFSNGLVQPSQNGDIWLEPKYTMMTNVVSDEELMEHCYVEYQEYLRNEMR